jgi:hypothetical protein
MAVISLQDDEHALSTTGVCNVFFFLLLSNNMFSLLLVFIDTLIITASVSRSVRAARIQLLFPSSFRWTSQSTSVFRFIMFEQPADAVAYIYT